MIEKNRTASRARGTESRDETLAPRHPDLLWARSGAMALTGWPEEAPRLAPAPLALLAEEWLEALRAVRDRPELHIDAAALLGERAAARGFTRSGQRSASGACRLLRTRDGWLALHLARADDQRLLPAWLTDESLGPVSEDAALDEAVWRALAERVAGRARDELVERGRLLGLAIAAATSPPAKPAANPRAVRVGGAAAPKRDPIVLDLSALWAGPLCTQLLGLSGARVIKVESTSRPDGARAGPPEFFDLLNADKESVALDLRTSAGVDALRALIARADLVVESARPRGLVQLGLDPAELLHSGRGLSWLSITGYGRPDPQGQWIAYGDDAGVAAGLATACGDDARGPIFCGDAIADPLTGLRAASEAARAIADGGGFLLDCSLRETIAHALADDRRFEAARVASEASGGCRVQVGAHCEPVAQPRMRKAARTAPELGADTRRVLREFRAC